MQVELFPHQQEAVDNLANGKILRGDPGVGKSITALGYFYIRECGGVINDWGSIKTPKDLYIITTAKKRDDGDWQRDAYYLGLMEDPTISVAGIKVTVDSWNNIEKYEGVQDAFFIFDEQKVVGSGTWAKSFVKLTKSNRWILATGTPGDNWMDYIPVFLANGFYKNRTEFKDTHVIYSAWTKFPKVAGYRAVPRLERNLRSILVEMRYERHTTRHLEVVVVAHDAEELERVTKKRWHVYEQRPLRDIAELFSVSRKVVNSNASRLEKLRELQQKHKRLIVFYNFDYELELLRTLGTPVSKEPPNNSPQPENPSSRSMSPSHSYIPMSDTDTSLRSMGGPTSSTRSGTEPNGSTDPITENAGLWPETPCPTQSAGSTPQEDPWTHLLSPEGMAENQRLAKMSSPGCDERSDESSTNTCVKPSTSGSTVTVPVMFRERPRTKFVPTTGDHNSYSAKDYVKADPSSCEPSSIKSPKMPPVPPTDSKPLELEETSPLTNTTVSDSSTKAIVSSAESSAGVDGSNKTGKRMPKALSGVDPEDTPGVVVAEWNGHKHQPVPTTDEWFYLVQYMAGSEAWNCTETDAMAFYSMTYSYKQFEQAQGRIDRLNTVFTDLWYYVFLSDSWIDRAIKKALDLKQDFNERRFRVYSDADLDIKEAA